MNSNNFNTACFGLQIFINSLIWGFPGSSDSKEFAGNAGNPGSILRLGTSPGEGNGDPYSSPENPMKEPGLQSMGSQRVRND